MTIIPDLVRIQALSYVQQPCSNPSKSPEMLRKVPKQKYDDLQVFCKLQQSPANYRAAFTRQRSPVRSQHLPLKKLPQKVSINVRHHLEGASRDARRPGSRGPTS